jgi:chromosomal replication initiation ATPase DnaA
MYEETILSKGQLLEEVQASGLSMSAKNELISLIIHRWRWWPHSRSEKVAIEDIQTVVADYYKIAIGDLVSKKRIHSVNKQRMMAMALAREFTDCNLPAIGDSFGGRDHTTVLHACTRMVELRKNDRYVEEDYRNLVLTLVS